MARDPRYDLLFEPVKIGPVTAPNRFYQVPHATGTGFRKPQTSAKISGIRAEGGWGVVCSAYCSIHPSSDEEPETSATLWDDEDVRSHALMVENVHRHGATPAGRTPRGVDRPALLIEQVHEHRGLVLGLLADGDHPGLTEGLQPRPRGVQRGHVGGAREPAPGVVEVSGSVEEQRDRLSATELAADARW